MIKHTATAVDDLGIMLVFGGYPNDEGVVYSLDLSSMEWSRIDNVQYKRNGHSADLIEGSVYLFGGYCGGKNDVQVYDIHNSTLQRVDTAGNPPSGRSFHGSAVI